MTEKALVLIKPDAMEKQLAGHIITDLYSLGLKMIGLKLVNVKRELAEQHYEHLKEKPFFEELLDHITGKLHNQENVIAIAYEGENAIEKIRKLAGETHPDKTAPNTIRGKYGKIHTQTNCMENVMHASDSPENGEKEIALWFNSEELI